MRKVSVWLLSTLTLDTSSHTGIHSEYESSIRLSLTMAVEIVFFFFVLRNLLPCGLLSPELCIYSIPESST